MINQFITLLVDGIGRAYRAALKRRLENDTAEVLMEHSQQVQAQLQEVRIAAPVTFTLAPNPPVLYIGQEVGESLDAPVNRLPAKTTPKSPRRRLTTTK